MLHIFYTRIDSQLDTSFARNDLQQKFRHVEYFTCDSLLIFTRFSPSISELHKLSYDNLAMLTIKRTPWKNIT